MRLRHRVVYRLHQWIVPRLARWLCRHWTRGIIGEAVQLAHIDVVIARMEARKSQRVEQEEG